MARSLLVSLVVAVGCALIVYGMGQVLDSATLSSVALWAGAGAGGGYFITTLKGRNERSDARD